MDPNTLYEQGIKAREEETRKFIVKVYGWMMLALIITGAAGLGTASSPMLLGLIFSSRFTFIGLLIAEVVLVIYLSSRLSVMSSGAAKFWFIIYAVINGVTLSSVFYIYDIGTVGYAFLVTAAIFGFMSVYGYITKTDLTAIGNLFVMGLFGLIIASVFNIFFHNDAFDLILTYVGVFIFIGLIGYDTQRIKNLSYAEYGRESEGNNASIMGAMILYLDFINLFIRLVRLIGRK